MQRPEYAIITGNGRSGTHWLMSLLDASSLTHCRSEPYGVDGSAFQRVPQLWQPPVAEDCMSRHWDEVVALSRALVGERDPGFDGPKDYIYPLPQRLGLARVLRHPVGRRALGVLQPRLWAGEWPLPAWLGDRRAMADAFAVFKINVDHRMLSWLLAERPQARILHIVRHPRERLDSWLRRFLARRDSAEVLAHRRARLEAVAAVEPAWREKFGDLEQIGLIEAEVWFWRYVNETTYEAGRNSPAYLRVIYERLAGNPLQQAQSFYEFCGLPWDARVEARIARSIHGPSSDRVSEGPGQPKPSRRARLTPEQDRIVERITRDSPLLAWW